MSSLNFDALLSTDNFDNGIRRIENQIRGVSNTAARETSVMDGAFKNIGVAIGTYFSASALQGFVTELINIRGEFQKTEIAFGTMLGSKAQAKELMADMVDLASKTPFGLQEVTDGAKRLLAFQVPANEVVDTLRRMGDVAAGLGVPMGQLINIYGQVKAQGKLMTNDLYQFMNAGIPILSELGKIMGKTDAEIKEMVGKGKIGFSEIQQVIQNLTSDGGIFYNLMAEQSKSLSGQVANLKDNFEQMLNNIGKDSEGFLSGGISVLNLLVENYKELGVALSFAVGTYGTYKAMLMVITALQHLQAEATLQQALAQGTLSTAQKYGAAVSVTAQRATASLNATLMANPLGIVIGLIGALSYAIYKYASDVDMATELQNQLTEEINKGKEGVDEKKAKIDALVTALESENTTNEEKRELLTKLNALTDGKLGKLDIEMAKTGELQGRVKSYIGTLYEQAEAMAHLENLKNLYKQKEKAEDFQKRVKNGKTTLTEDISTIVDKDSYAGTGLKEFFQGFTDDSVYLRNRAQNELNAINKEIAKQKQWIEKNSKVVNEATKENFNKTPTPTQVKNEKKKKAPKPKETAMKGSLGELENQLSEVQKNLKDKTLTTDTKRINELLAREKILQEKIAKIRKEYEIKKWDDELNELERQWKVRYQLAEHYGEEVAKKQFPKLSGESYQNDIENQFKPLNEKIQNGTPMSEDEIAKWQKLKEIIINLNGEKDPFTNWKDTLAKSLSTASTFAEKLDLLNKARENLTPQQKSSGYLAEINRQIEQVKLEYDNYYTQILESQKTYEEKSLALKKEYDAIKASEQYQNASEEDRTKIDNLFKDKQSQLSGELLKASGDWTLAFSNLEYLSTASINRLIERLEAFRQANANNLQPTELRELTEVLDKLREKATFNPFKGILDGINDWVKAKAELSTAQEEYTTAVSRYGATAEQSIQANRKLASAEEKVAKSKQNTSAQIGDSQGYFSSILGSVNSVADAFGGFDDATKDTIEDIANIGNAAFDLGKSIATGDVAGMIKAGAQLIGSVFKAMSGDKKKERNIKQWASEVKNLEHAYKDLEYAMKSALGDDKYNTQRAQIRNLEKQRELLQKMKIEELSKKKSDSGKVQEYNDKMRDIARTIEDTKQNLIKDVLQTDVKDLASQFGDALVNAFEKGENAAKSLDGVTKNVFKNIMKNALNMQLEKRMKPILDNLLRDVGFDKDGNGTFQKLTTEQIEGYKEIFRNTALQYSQFAQEIAKVTTGGVGDKDTLKGGIQGMSEETAGVLAGQFNAIRINTGELVANSLLTIDAVQNVASVLTKIEANTATLHAIKRDISELNSKVKGDAQLRAKGF